MLHKSTLGISLVLAIAATACGGSAAPSPTLPPTPTANPSAAAVGQTSKTLAQGSIAALPAPPLYINFVSVPQAPNAPLSHAHVAGFVYAVVGVHRYAIQGGATTDLQPDEGAFVGQDIVHTHSNPGTTQSEWYFIALRNVGARTAPATFPGQAVVYETATLTTQPAGKYNEQLNLVTLERGGRTAAHRHGGIEALVVLDGTVQLRVANQEPTTLTKGKGAYVLPNTALQAINTGDMPARFLAYFATLDGAEFSTNVNTVP